MCDINYSGNDNALDAAQYTSITINGQTISNSKPLGDFGSLTSDLNDTLSSASITYAGVLVSTTTNKTDIALNTNYNEVFVQIFYPSVALTGSIEVNINGTPQTFYFDKIPTA